MDGIQLKTISEIVGASERPLTVRFRDPLRYVYMCTCMYDYGYNESVCMYVCMYVWRMYTAILLTSFYAYSYIIMYVMSVYMYIRIYIIGTFFSLLNTDYINYVYMYVCMYEVYWQSLSTHDNKISSSLNTYVYCLCNFSSMVFVYFNWIFLLTNNTLLWVSLQLIHDHSWYIHTYIHTCIHTSYLRNTYIHKVYIHMALGRYFQLLDSAAGPPQRKIVTSYLPANTRFTCYAITTCNYLLSYWYVCPVYVFMYG